MPWNIAYSKLTDKIYVIGKSVIFYTAQRSFSDDGDRSIKIFDPETGRMTQQIGPRIGFGRKLGYMWVTVFVDGFWKLKRYGICVDGDGDILVSEAEHGQVLIFKADGSGPEVVADEGQLITRRGLGSNKFAFRSFATNGNWHYPRGLLGSLRPLQSLYQIIPVQTWSKRKRRGNGSRSSGKNQYHKL